MSNETKLTAADLAFYLGANCQTPVGRGIIAGVSSDQTGDWVAVNMPGARQYMPPEDVLPILRPLSDMIQDEADNEIWDSIPKYEDFKGLVCHVSPAFRYLIYRHFDLFGWIPSGLAIDKTKIETL